MTTLTMGIWYAVGDMVVPKLMAQESAALIILAASLLVFRTFRERYLLIWIVGWLAYFVSRWTLRGGSPEQLPRELIALAQAEFVLTVCLFAAAVFAYAHAAKLLRALLVVAPVVVGFAAVRPLYWPE